MSVQLGSCETHERSSRDAAQLLKMFYYSIVSSHRAVIADYKVARAKS